MMISINEPELLSIELIRVALSEPTPELREKAITNVKHDIISERLELLSDHKGSSWVSDPANADLVKWAAKTSAERHSAGRNFVETGQRYEKTCERKLNIAEQIGLMVYVSIHDGTFEGVQAQCGILSQVADVAHSEGVSGARDKDVLRKIWNTYRGVVHLGMAIIYCENDAERANVLHMAENFRRVLGQNCPRGTTSPYVAPGEQISFLYLSMLSGPRFRGRGLPFNLG